MLDFLMISTRSGKRGIIEIYPDGFSTEQSLHRSANDI